MAKRSKKRTKRYQGEDAKQPVATKPVVHRYEAVERSRLGEWWQTKKRIARPVAIAGGITLIAAWLLTELIRIVF
jgi:hypothetical protein